MDSTRTPRELRGRRRSHQVALLIGWIYCVSAQAQLLDTVPADVAAVTVVRSPREFLKKANATLAKLSPGAPAIEWSDVERRLGPAAAGFCDIDQPLVIVLTRAEGEGGTLVVGSRVNPPEGRGPGGIIAAPIGKGPAVGPRDKYYVRTGNITYVSDRRRAMRGFIRVRPASSLAATMDPQEREFAKSCDAFVYVRMEAWQDRIRPYVSFISAMAKLSVTAEPSENPTEQKMRSEMTNWFIDGGVSVLDQMSSISLGLTLDGETIRLRHHHHFEPGGSVANYLGKVRASEEPPWACLPDRPFLAAFATNWWSVEQSSIMSAMTRKVFDSVNESGNVPDEVSKKVVDASGQCYANMRGMNMLMTMDSSEDPHLEFFGSYAFDDAESGLKQMRVIQANASEALAAITPGGFVGCGKDLTRDGVKYNEVELSESIGGAQFKQEMREVYGPEARVRQAQVGKKRVASCINQSADDFIKLIKAGEHDQPLLNNKRVKHLTEKMQRGAKAWLLLDLRRVTDLAASVVAGQTVDVDDTAANGQPAHKPRVGQIKLPGRKSSDREVGPLLGWSAQAGERYVSGEFLISVDDAATAVSLAAEMIAPYREDAPAPPSK